MRSSARVLRRFIWKHVELTNRHISRLRNPPISSDFVLSSPLMLLSSEAEAMLFASDGG
jgi:hypothetical protein